jgi:co-chaperonin GroES (HSP10)
VFFITHNEIKELFSTVDYNILMYTISISIYPNVIIDGYFLIPHEDGIHITKVINNIPLKIALIKNDSDNTKVKVKPDDTKIYKDFIKFKEMPINNAIIALYSSLDLLTFNFIINKILSTKTLSEIDNFIATCLYREGVLIAGKEISIGLTDKYIGFINIFSDEFEPLLYNNGNYKSLTVKQLEQLKKNRKEIIIPEMKKEKNHWGLFVPIFTDKEKKNKRNVFKILTPGEAFGKKTGIVCTSLHKPQHQKIMENLKLSMSDAKSTKENNCNAIAVHLYKTNRISLNPNWKPLISNI